MIEPSPHTQAKRIADNIEAKYFNRPRENAGQKELRAFEDKALVNIYSYALTGSSPLLKRSWRDAVDYLSERIERLGT